MRAMILTFVAAAGLVAVSATAQSPGSKPAGPQMTVCVDSEGQRHQAICRPGVDVGDATTCSCQEGTTAVTAPVCAAGESPAESSSAASQAMKQSLKTGTLNDVQVGGKRLCIVPRHRGGTPSVNTN
ncbi:MAG TPA: hypothetical protein VGL66_00780 [Caulobacteraceae bacterium]|jgi:hypothetical protein